MSSVFGNSAFTLQKQAPTQWTFSKESRFRSPKRSVDVEFRIPPSTLSMRFTSIGFGNRLELKNPKGKDSPPPGSYDLPSSFNNSKGPKMVKQSILPLIKNRNSSPGPGAYDPVLNGSSSPKYSFRIKIKDRKKFQPPAPGAYDPRFTLTEFSAYKEIGFGFDQRSLNGTKSTETGPGPGHYNI